MTPRFKTADDAVAFLYNRLNFEKQSRGESFAFRLDRMRDLVTACGFADWLYDTDPDMAGTPPRSRPRILHVAGTKGKGSVTTLLQSILTASGHRVGTYTSPHLESIHGRFRVDGEPCSDAALAGSLSRLADAIESVPASEQVTFFELTTTAAIDIFAAANCDFVILEVGLGGRLDSTNVFDSEVAAITTIGLDHQEILGPDHAAIAAEKAGIIKSGRVTFTSVRQPEALASIESIAAAKRSDLRIIDRDWTVTSTPQPQWGSRLVYRSIDTPPIELVLAIEGAHQVINASLAIAIARHVSDPSVAELQAGLATAAPPARLERRYSQRGHTVIVDAAHNVDSIAAMCQVLRDRTAGRGVTFVFASSVDKDVAAMLDQIQPLANRLILTKFADNPRAAEPSSLLHYVNAVDSKNIRVVENADEALRIAVDLTTLDDWIVVCGSFFLAAQLRLQLAAEIASTV